MRERTFSWQAPPPVARKGAPPKWRPRLLPLMDQPGEWAQWPASTPNAAYVAASHLASRRLSVPPGRWEFTSRTADGVAAVYARYLGPEEEA